MQITINVSESTIEAARAHGMAVEEYAEQLLGERPRRPLTEERRAELQRAIDGLNEVRQGTSLKGLRIRDLINEGRKY